ncbi:putative transcriptional regulator [Cellulomonas oligotrophica]|nr:ASCH domain-containing protein [Cellulomonas oligotrophica]NYD85757.1 putative transcriptional regulator [Cellulomonas oligotrophica]
MMSIRPPFADAILEGTKLVEFRKRRLAPDVTTVLIYATLPVGRVVGVFEIAGYDVGSPTAVWERHKSHAGIGRAGYRDYYRGSNQAVGLLVRDARRLSRSIALADLDPTLPVPQSFLYLALDPRASEMRPRGTGWEALSGALDPISAAAESR